jgi:hypothetical protein
MDEIVIAMRNMRNDACDRSILPFNRSRAITHNKDLLLVVFYVQV